MDYDSYFSNITPDRLAAALDLTENSHVSPEAFLASLNGLDEDLKQLFIIRGMMYVCVELEFGLQGNDIWSACDLYTQVAKASNELYQVDDGPEGFQYYS